MTTLFVRVVLFFVVLSTWAFAGGRDGEIGFSGRTLVKKNFALDKVSFDLYARDVMDADRLMKDVKLEKGETVNSIDQKINKIRMRLYPNQELILSVSQPKSSGAKAVAGLVRFIHWWNNINCSTCTWYAQYNSTVATAFVDDVQYGAYDIYDKVGNGNWIFRYHLTTGAAVTRYSWGPLKLRGFQGSSAGVQSKSDIVLYFFN